VTFERNVLPKGSPILEGPTRATRHSYKYPNGSEIIIGGMDNPTRIMSTEYDIAYVQEAIELTEEDWESLTTRLRNNRLPYQQLIADTNPDRPTHWLKIRCNTGKTLLLESRHEDNPTLWDGAQWTPEGLRYLSKLDALTGPRKARLRRDQWVQAEGVVYEDWDSAHNVIDRFIIPDSWARYISIDFGYRDPFVAQFWATDEDRRSYLYREIVRTGKLVEDMAREIRHYIGIDGVRPRKIVCDHDAEGRATLERHLDIKTHPAIKEILYGIGVVAGRIRKQGDGRPSLFVFRDALVDRDQTLSDRKEPIGLAEEIEGYIWEDPTRKELPVDWGNHSCDSTRYHIATNVDPPRGLLKNWRIERI